MEGDNGCSCAYFSGSEVDKSDHWFVSAGVCGFAECVYAEMCPWWQERCGLSVRREKYQYKVTQWVTRMMWRSRNETRSVFWKPLITEVCNNSPNCLDWTSSWMVLCNVTQKFNQQHKHSAATKADQTRLGCWIQSKSLIWIRLCFHLQGMFGEFVIEKKIYFFVTVRRWTFHT